MRGLTVAIATTLTFAYGFAAQAAMKADRAEAIRRLGVVSTPETTPALDASHVWYGGTLDPVTVEAPAHSKCTLI